MAETNSENLNLVNEHLTAKVSRSCNCWIWLMIIFIKMVFIMMVLFMKLFPKRKYSTPDTVDETLGDIGGTYTHFLNNNTLVIDNMTIHAMEL